MVSSTSHLLTLIVVDMSAKSMTGMSMASGMSSLALSHSVKAGWPVGKKKKKRLQRDLDGHQQHHAAIHKYIIRKRIEDGERVEGVTVVMPQSHALPEH